jgi:protein-S-isoprenylcysteine O-methyltransferase Ste14
MLAAPALLIVHLTAVIAEETYLREKFGASYVAFQGRVRRYL